MSGTDLHLVTKENTFERHAMPNEKIIAMLKKNRNVEYIIIIILIVYILRVSTQILEVKVH